MSIIKIWCDFPKLSKNRNIPRRREFSLKLKNLKPEKKVSVGNLVNQYVAYVRLMDSVHYLPVSTYT